MGVQQNKCWENYCKKYKKTSAMESCINKAVSWQLFNFSEYVTLSQVSCQFCEMFKKSLFTKHFRACASAVM